MKREKEQWKLRGGERERAARVVLRFVVMLIKN